MKSVVQLEAARAIRRHAKCRGAVRQWVKLRERNEALDLEVYALAALYIGGPVLLQELAARAARLARPAGDVPRPRRAPRDRRPRSRR